VVARVLALAESAAAQGRPLPSPELWQRIAWSLGNAHIGTFHGFASGVLRRAAVHLGVDPAFSVLEDEDAEVLLRQSACTPWATLAQRDVTAVVELMGASGGLGERNDRGLVTVLTALVRRLDEDGRRADDAGVACAVDPGDMTALRRRDTSPTSPRPARPCPRCAPTAPPSACARSPRRSGAPHGAHPGGGPRAHAGAARPRAAARAQPHAAHRARRRRGPRGPRAARAGRRLVVSKHLAGATRTVVAAAQRGYERAKRQRGALDFADLMRRLRDALRDHAPLRREWKRRYDAVLVDEFQDTNRVQRDLLYLLRERAEL
jgi:ATP-dependent helicase/nuclease subunit A